MVRDHYLTLRRSCANVPKHQKSEIMFNKIHRYFAFTSLLHCKVMSVPMTPGSISGVHYLRKETRNSTLTFMDAELSKMVDERLMGVPGFSIDQLMELAGLSVASAVVDHWENNHKMAYNKNVLVFCGPGNNGGDGLVAARHLKHFGFQPTIVYPKKGNPSLFVNLAQQLEDLGIEILGHVPSPTHYATFGLVIDSLFGFSFQGPSREPFSSMIRLFAESPIPVFSVDLPSGWDVDRGDIHGTGFTPAAVISLTAPKLCMKGYAGVHYVGGRFVPPKLAAELGLTLPEYGADSKQYMLLSSGATGEQDAGGEQEAISVIYVTASSREEARRVAAALLERRLAACVNIVPGVESLYEWEGRLETSQEVLMMVKTRHSLVPSVTAAVKELHSYDVPEVLAVNAAGGSGAYMDWVRANTAHTSSHTSSASLVPEADAQTGVRQSLCEVGAVEAHAVTGDVLSTGSALQVAAETIRYTADGTSDTGSV